MSTLNIEEIRARANAATDGPWEASFEGTVFGPNTYGIAYDIGRQEDADFIAHAREDIPALLEEIGRARASEKYLSSALECQQHFVNVQKRVYDERLAELRSELDTTRRISAKREQERTPSSTIKELKARMCILFLRILENLTQ